MIKKFFRTIIYALIFCGILSNNSFGDDYQSRLKAAKRYAQVTPLSKMLDSAFENLSKQLPDDKRDAFIEEARSLLDVPKIETSMIELMAKHFTTDELNALTNFYSSPLGKSVMSKFGPYMADAQMIIFGNISEAIKKSHLKSENNKP
jgi:hypothetical protein